MNEKAWNRRPMGEVKGFAVTVFGDKPFICNVCHQRFTFDEHLKHECEGAEVTEIKGTHKLGCTFPLEDCLRRDEPCKCSCHGVEIPCEQYGCGPACLDKHFKPMGEVTEEERRELALFFWSTQEFTKEECEDYADKLIAQGWRKRGLNGKAQVC